jgi:hypothetical protein
MKTPIIRATIDNGEGHYKIVGQCLDDQCKIVDWAMSTFSLVKFEAELSYISDNFDCQIVRQFKA